jgi:excinuclease ABC subunit A
MERPDVDLIEGLSPAISIEQKTGNHNPRSTVGTVTEILDYLRLLFARVGTPRCWHTDEAGHVCARPIQSQSATQIVDHIMATNTGTPLGSLAQPCQHRNECRFAGAVRPQQRKKLAVLDC